jgi:hypothetical protein
MPIDPNAHRPLGPADKPKSIEEQQKPGTDASGKTFNQHMNTPKEKNTSETQKENFNPAKTSDISQKENTASDISKSNPFHNWFKGKGFTKADYHEFMKNEVRWLSTEMKRQQAQMKKASEKLKRSIEGQ